jgi:hypothetical protein
MMHPLDVSAEPKAIEFLFPSDGSVAGLGSPRTRTIRWSLIDSLDRGHRGHGRGVHDLVPKQAADALCRQARR